MKRLLLLLLCTLPAWAQQQGLPNDIPPLPSNLYQVPSFIGGGVNIGSNISVNGQFNVKTYGAVGDAQSITNGVTAGGSTKTVTSVSNPFKATDVGKFIYCASAGTLFVSLGTKITAFNSAGSVSISQNDNGAATSSCVWYTKDDTSAFCCGAGSANAAAAPNVNSSDPNSGTQISPYAGTIYCPPGGYVVSGRIVVAQGVGSNILQSFQGAGRNQCIIYVSPATVDPGDGFAWLMSWFDGTGVQVSDFTVAGMGVKVSASHPAIELQGINGFFSKNVTLTNVGDGSGANGVFSFLNSADGTVDNLWMQTTQQITTTNLGMSGLNQVTFNNPFVSNAGVNVKVSNNGARNAFGSQGPTLVGGAIDECAAAASCVQLTSNATLNAVGTVFLVSNQNNVQSISVDGTSTLYGSDMNCGQYAGAVNNTGCLTLTASGARAFVTGSTLRAGLSGPAIVTVAGSQFIDVGGNEYLDCNAVPTCSPITVANIAQLITSLSQYKATVTHTPNTCYATTGNLLATAQNLCTILLDQNYGLVNVTAQSGGTTPANSSCATPPVITLSDGTRSATLTMTSGKTQWSSAVDSITNIPQIFASGATLTVSIGANTCATPPANVSVNWTVQSVMNP